MGCPGGCVAGAGTLAPVRDGMVSVQRYSKSAVIESSTESPHLDVLEIVEEKE